MRLNAADPAADGRRGDASRSRHAHVRGPIVSGRRDCGARLRVTRPSPGARCFDRKGNAGVPSLRPFRRLTQAPHRWRVPRPPAGPIRPGLRHLRAGLWIRVKPLERLSNESRPNR
ncbi:hypothetical protein A33M_3981 [Rhodovulum sp. PH10]|nr:hypothetical protein A33M_3981 [Rhodovulum sp. PH10]